MLLTEAIFIFRINLRIAGFEIPKKRITELKESPKKTVL
jgi:hypothetical protein